MLQICDEEWVAPLLTWPHITSITAAKEIGHYQSTTGSVLTRLAASLESARGQPVLRW